MKCKLIITSRIIPNLNSYILTNSNKLFNILENILTNSNIITNTKNYVGTNSNLFVIYISTIIVAFQM